MPTNTTSDLLILRAEDVKRALAGREPEIIDLVAEAYKVHARGDTSVPHSAFVALPGLDNRAIALAGCVRAPIPLAGVKWIASVPANIERGIDRASAVVVLSCIETGRPIALIEGALISALRTAASAVMFARMVAPDAERMAFVGCGVINFHIARLALASCPRLQACAVYDIRKDRADDFAGRLRLLGRPPRIQLVRNGSEIYRSAEVVSFATTSSEPYLDDPGVFLPGATILHVSLRDLGPDVILASDNITDDIDHVCRQRTSLHLAELKTGNRDFVRCTVGDICLGRARARSDMTRPVIFSPFGLAILDLAVAGFALRQANHQGIGTIVRSFSGPSMLTLQWN